MLARTYVMRCRLRKAARLWISFLRPNLPHWRLWALYSGLWKTPEEMRASLPCPLSCAFYLPIDRCDTLSGGHYRNLLAEALGISESGRPSGHNQVTWNPDLVAFFRVPANQAFVKNVEKALADFVAGDKKAHVLPHMPEIRRKIAMEMAEIYRITTQLVDEEPRRSIQLIRRIDSRIPTPLLSQVSVPTPSRLGSLGDLRKPATIVKPASPSGSVASAWRSGTTGSGTNNPNSNVGSRSLAPSPIPPTSGNLPTGSGRAAWARPNIGSVTRTPLQPPASWVAPEALTHAGEAREDIPANWEDE
ncbi:unnamed protein product [Rhizoctonia solani]|uniref:R3H domain-containing protein n=1 Tax=Rhizoctonia solani TaxID=456999 RepID=A0A8H3GRG5_9AGAM|nr:unnamed protein product [Rhizoctonia solani]